MRPLLLVLTLLVSGCAHAVNYPDPAGPRRAGSFVGVAPAPTMKVVSFNVKFARRVDRLIDLLRWEPRVKDADVIALQEMDGAGTEAVARALSLNYVYYPASVHPADRNDFGNAILSRWPIREDRKIVLPHVSRLRRQQRIAVAATVEVAGHPVRVYSVHLETIGNLSGRDRLDQARAVLRDADSFTIPAIVAGDFNSRGTVAQAVARSTFDWVSRDAGPTIARFAWDHVLVRGLALREHGSAGVSANYGASDHRPVWVELVLPETAAP